MSKILKILVFVGNYLPAYKAGGAVRSVANLVVSLKGFDFNIVTSDRDLGDHQPFAGIDVNQWVPVTDAQVFYLSPGLRKAVVFFKSIFNQNYDVVYLNSCFNFKYSIVFLALRRFGFFAATPVLLAPRGEFSMGAISIKKFKKLIYLFFAIKFGFFRNIFWQASSIHEKNDILRIIGVDESRILIASDLPSSVVQGQYSSSDTFDDLSIVFISRISRIKNLKFAIELLAKINGRVRFDIYGPIEDEQYWGECQLLIDLLPDNIVVNYRGLLDPNMVVPTFSQYHLFFFPTLGENYGHVIAESLSAGTPVLLSTETPWNNLECHQLGWNVSLNDPARFVDILNMLSLRSRDDLVDMKSIAKNNSHLVLNSKIDIEVNQNMFKSVARGFRDN